MSLEKSLFCTFYESLGRDAFQRVGIQGAVLGDEILLEEVVERVFIPLHEPQKRAQMDPQRERS